MAYMPNYGYPQYGYQNQFNPNQFGQNQFVQPTIQNQIPQPVVSQSQQIPTLYGKVVDGIDVVRSVDVPLGASFILPKADGSACYCKGWNPDGTTYIKEYKLIEQSPEKEEILQSLPDWSEKFDDISDKINELNRKIDKFKPSSTTSVSMKKRRVEVDEDDE